MAAKRKVKKKQLEKTSLEASSIQQPLSITRLLRLATKWVMPFVGQAREAQDSKGSKKSTPFAAQQAVEDAIVKVKEHGIKELGIKIQGSVTVEKWL